MSLLDQWLPEYQFVERHSLRVTTPDLAVWNAVKTLTPEEVGVVGALMAIRSLPAKLSGKRGKPLRKGTPILDAAVMLEEKAPREMVLGLVGQFWKLDGGPRVEIHNSEEFAAFRTPGFLKVAVNFEIGNGLISTETRIHALDDSARRKFRLYWMLIRPGSGWIRLAWLRAIARRSACAFST